MRLQNAVGILYDWSAGLPPDRGQLLDGAHALDAMAKGTDQKFLKAAASLRELAKHGAPCLDPAERKKAAMLAAYLRRIAIPEVPD